MSKIIDMPENEFNNLIPDWAKNINNFLIDKKSFKIVEKPLFYNGYSIDKEIFMATYKCVNVRKPNPSKRYIKKLFDDILIKPIQKFCNENSVSMTYKIFPFHDNLWGDIMLIQFKFTPKLSNKILKMVEKFYNNLFCRNWL